MDLDEWELVPDDSYLQIHDDGGTKIFSRKYQTDSSSAIEMNYFICPSPRSSKFLQPKQHSRVPKQVVPLPIHLEPTPIDHLPKIVEINILPGVVSEKIRSPPEVGADQDTVSQVFFKKMKETEFADMKMDSPKSTMNRVIESSPFQFEEKAEAFAKSEDLQAKLSSAAGKTEKTKRDFDVEEDEKSSGFNLWNWGLTGVGAICSFGMAAAATVCIIIIGSHQKNKENQQNQKLHFQIYADDKRMKQVVHHATKLNEAISAVRGVPLARAQITFGGYCESL